jgi:hypothetical protein
MGARTPVDNSVSSFVSYLAKLVNQITSKDGDRYSGPPFFGDEHVARDSIDRLVLVYR